ncbi:hypothetical protein [Reticulibacter mediterranei]|nr:hypothetical protein [Reticulibacter mediterranei]
MKDDQIFVEEAAMQTSTSTPPSGNTALRIERHVSVLLDQYLASLVGVLFILPIVAAIITVISYILTESWYAILWGCAGTCAFWLLIAVPLCRFVSASGANRRSYDLLMSDLAQLKTRLEALKRQQKEQDEPLPKYSQIALAEVEAGYSTLQESLNSAPSNLRWISGIGYLDAWATLHQAEEALIEVEPINMVLENALYDARRIEKSAIGNTDELLNQLLQAVKDLDPAAMVYFKEHQPTKISEDLHDALQHQTRGIEQIARAFKTVHPGANIDFHEQEPSVALPLPDEEARARARVALREIRHTINDFRDTSWDGLLRVRNHLMFAMTLTGLVTYILLCLVIMIHVPASAITAASIFYIIGAIAGMFGRFYREANARAAVDDYGLTVMRLFATPLLSGLAGIGGAFITLIFSSSLAPTATTSALSSLFNTSPQLLLAAAFFGLTPDLIIKSLQEKAEKYASDLKSSKSTEL